jgi:BMFP domain-containing protein YqiC
MQSFNEILNDISRVASGAAGSFCDIKREVESSISTKVEKCLQNNGFATKEEFSTLQAMLAKSLIEQEKLKQRLAALEGKINPAE